MKSIEFITKSPESSISNLESFCKENDFFSHVIIIDNPRISGVSALDLSLKCQKILRQKILCTISLSNKSISEYRRILESLRANNIAGAVLVHGESHSRISMQEALTISKNYGLLTLCATHHHVREYLDFGADFVTTQSFYDLRDIEAFLARFSEYRDKIIPSFLPFFNSAILARWRESRAKSLGITIPASYDISQNCDIFRAIVAYPHCHISMLDSDFSHIALLVKNS